MGKTKDRKLKLIVTHSGKFHADDVFAVASFKILLGDFCLTRTRDEDIISKGNIVIDVGGIYEEKKNRFDHHQPEGAGIRKNGIPYSSFGLVWKKYGKMLCGSAEVASYLDQRMVQQIDAVDNGFSISKPIVGVPEYAIPDMVDAMVPSWNEDKDVDDAFREAVDMAKIIIQREIIKGKAKFKAEKFIKGAYKNSKDKRILILKRYYPWSEAVFQFPETMFVIYPQNNGDTWHAGAVRKNLVDFKLRLKFPKSWAGKKDKELADISGVPDALFCHKNLFLAVAKSKEGAINLAKVALRG